MLRYIMETTFCDSCNGCTGSYLWTIDGDAKQCEKALLSGGRGETGYEHTRLLGVEIINEILIQKGDIKNERD